MTQTEKKLPFEKNLEKANKESPRILYRSNEDYMLAGVLGGLAAFWNINSTVLRLLFLFSIVLTGGLMIAVYFILMKAIPIEVE